MYDPFKELEENMEQARSKRGPEEERERLKAEMAAFMENSGWEDLPMVGNDIEVQVFYDMAVLGKSTKEITEERGLKWGEADKFYRSVYYDLERHLRGYTYSDYRHNNKQIVVEPAPRELSFDVREAMLHPETDNPETATKMLLLPIGFFMRKETRVYNALRSGHVDWMGDLVSRPQIELMKIRNFGNVCHAWVKNRLAELGLKFRYEKI